MHPPPGTTPTTQTAAGHDRQECDRAHSSRRAQLRRIREHKGMTGPQAKKWLDNARRRFRADYGREWTDLEELAWMMRQAPGPGRQPTVLKRPWRVAS